MKPGADRIHLFSIRILNFFLILNILTVFDFETKIIFWLFLSDKGVNLPERRKLESLLMCYFSIATKQEQNRTVQYSTVQYSTVQYSTVQYSTVSVVFTVQNLI